MIERMDTVCLKVHDVAASSLWYQEILGFKESDKGDGYRVLSIGDSGTALTIEEGDEGTLPGNHAYPIFFTKDIEQTRTKLMEQSIKVSQLKKEGRNTFFDVYDIDNNKLQVCYWE
ncbi:VOC family protein [Peribacillus sp. FSL H8-0477]|uniref:VOC family protein n=1 Tax=Peribacillus sp. FSL H8-0477 TaxID=2921388 RepID=UPI0030FB1F70